MDRRSGFQPRGLKLLIVAAVIAVAAAGLLSRFVNHTAGVSCIAGVCLGAVSFAALAVRVRSSTAPEAWRRWLGGVLRWTYFAALVAILHLLIIVYHADVLWVTVGFTYSLLIFALFMAQSGPQRQRRADKPPLEPTDQEH